MRILVNHEEQVQPDVEITLQKPYSLAALGVLLTGYNELKWADHIACLLLSNLNKEHLISFAQIDRHVSHKILTDLKAGKLQVTRPEVEASLLQVLERLRSWNVDEGDSTVNQYVRFKTQLKMEEYNDDWLNETARDDSIMVQKIVEPIKVARKSALKTNSLRGGRSLDPHTYFEDMDKVRDDPAKLRPLIEKLFSFVDAD